MPAWPYPLGALPTVQSCDSKAGSQAVDPEEAMHLILVFLPWRPMLLRDKAKLKRVLEGLVSWRALGGI